MEKFILVIHALAALVIIGLVLLQQGKGAAMGASFGAGASQTVFGSEGSGNFFTRATWTIAALFFCTSFGLAVIAKNNSQVASQGEIVPVIQQEVPAVQVPASDIPEAQAPAANAESDVPATAEPAASEAASQEQN
ncbi:preprotein translocase subunit SecG [Cellvibrio japonicus]|uniref:Protein-export membrane protein SecG n=1 Tax=Cellvibrio japonicus (strain Ueda107) TaxID=498211 RepID=B3PLP9_CELJU|nr:preprotein translocase subunit SecG [Cellvibrio japonicus]ACE85090.1 putative preprotein translocase SecG subunit [Cellvibrio japonicus Ueda107]QEI13031.1 preprotein translocase subunit SecG [Cellvibrio japonicus]QEI16605.1 preprotein translocase subunit SecG [Cellvibrio japonicus]QEI20183.1 preprotein translocase subunit SecG [Cellvibrio japonicus]